jgi:hypothetical protein
LWFLGRQFEWDPSKGVRTPVDSVLQVERPVYFERRPALAAWEQVREELMHDVDAPLPIEVMRKRRCCNVHHGMDGGS